MWSLFYFKYVRNNDNYTALYDFKAGLMPGSQIGQYSADHFRIFSGKKMYLLFAKQEWQQLSGSVKARAAYAIFRDAIEKNQLHPGKILLDATSGNTGIAYAQIGKIAGYSRSTLPSRKCIRRKKGDTSVPGC